MSGEYIAEESSIEVQKKNKRNTKQRVDINVLLNKVRADKKKEKFENFIFLGLVSLVIVVAGLIVSL